MFSDTRIEEHTRIHAGGAKRIDIVIPKISTVIEVKYVRDSTHAKKLADELRIDFESYHIHPSCKKLIAIVWDSNNLIINKLNFITLNTIGYGNKIIQILVVKLKNTLSILPQINDVVTLCFEVLAYSKFRKAAIRIFCIQAI